MIYYGLPGPWAPEVEDLVVGKVRQMVKSLR
jgi:exosome complex RNA-binding protein Rrp4